MRISRIGEAPGTPSAWETPSAAPAHRRLHIKSGFTVIDSQQRRLHQRARILGFGDLAGYLAARSQHHVDVAQLASELDTTIAVVGRLLDRPACAAPPRPARSANHRRATDQRLLAPVADLQLSAYDRLSGTHTLGASRMSRVGEAPLAVESISRSADQAEMSRAVKPCVMVCPGRVSSRA